jgi:glutamate-1-semialdehyde 2,1-aminomutase
MEVARAAHGERATSLRSPFSFVRSRSLQRRFHDVIPGGAHTYAKGDDQYPEFAPVYIDRGRGCHVWDVDGNEYIEYGMGLRAVALGHAYAPVVDAACRQMRLGANFTRPSPIELECAETLRSMIPGAEMVKFAKNGSDATSAAVKLSRAYTGRDLIAICGDHPFFSVDDWFIGTTAMDAGIPDAIKGLTVKFRYNDLDGARDLFRRFPGRIACVLLEPERDSPPSGGFLHKLQQLCREQGAVFALDEMITGFRWHNGGGQAFHTIVPDLSTFGKALGNGFAVSALVGKRDIMRLAGLHHDRPRVFLLSTTHGAETHALAAALEVMRIYQREPVVASLWAQGQKLARGIQEAVEDLGLGEFFRLTGRPCCLVYSTRDGDKQPSQAFRTLFLQETIKRGVLAPSFVISYSHSDEDVRRTVEAVHQALAVYRDALADGIEKYLQGRPVRPALRRFN